MVRDVQAGLGIQFSAVVSSSGLPYRLRGERSNGAEAQGNQVTSLGGSSWSACTTSGCSMTKVMPS